jgi:hypothetical protein
LINQNNPGVNSFNIIYIAIQNYFRKANKRKVENPNSAKHFEEKKPKTNETYMDAFSSNTRLKQEESQVEFKSHSFTPSGDHFLNTFKVICPWSQTNVRDFSHSFFCHEKLSIKYGKNKLYFIASLPIFRNYGHSAVTTDIWYVYNTEMQFSGICL